MKTTYATVTESEGVNYREIADTMTSIGYRMNHSSARNYVLRVMKKFAKSITDEWDVDVADHDLDKIIKNPQFQQGICEILQVVDSEKNGRFKR